MVKTDKPVKSNGGNSSRTYNNQTFIGSDEVRYEKYPLNVLTFKRDKTGLHPTQKPIALTILSHYFGLPLENFPYFETVHNYIDTNNHILRKGAISAQENELVLIPLNMRDGSLIARGKGNPEWNYSAPHGAGRLMSRKQAKNSIALADFEESMRGIYSTSVNTDTLDESPFAYKDHKEIIAAVDDTVHIVSHLKPIYNRKA